MRFLILSANTGGGHNAAAYAIQEELNRQGIESDIEDCLGFISEKTSDFISWGHSYLYKHMPRVFGHAYRLEEQHSSQLIYDSIALGAAKYHAFITERDYQAVICVHVFSSTLVTEEQRRFGKSLPHFFVATDYTCSPGGGDAEADAWLIPDAGLTEEFVQCGAPRGRVFATGIPIRRAFTDRLDKTQAREELGLPSDGRIVLMCCGSIGCGKMNRIVPDFARALPSDCTLVVICGNNEKLYDQLLEDATPRVVPVGFTDKITKYMMAADVCLSKPGGLSTTELLAVGVPSVLVLVVPGCESRNMAFITAKGLAIGTEDWETAVERALTLLNDSAEISEMRRKLQKYNAGHGAENIVNFIKNAIRNE